MKLKRWICHQINRRLTFNDIAAVADAAGVPVSSLVALHPSFNLSEQGERLAA